MAVDAFREVELSVSHRAAEVFHITVDSGRVVTPVGEFSYSPCVTVRDFQARAGTQGSAALHAFQTAMQAVIGIR